MGQRRYERGKLQSVLTDLKLFKKITYLWATTREVFRVKCIVQYCIPILEKKTGLKSITSASTSKKLAN